ncbi:hypothetical protein AGMMS49992_02830 [Clostridia bacterium]|nr:hypothetical protein AGMMS49992_02830 [Clostridia bacterium]
MSNRIIFVAGLVASGKTSFSRRLASFVGLPCYNKDSVKSALSEIFAINDREQSKQFSEATFILLKHIAVQFMKANTSAVQESNKVWLNVTP